MACELTCRKEWARSLPFGSWARGAMKQKRRCRVFFVDRSTQAQVPHSCGCVPGLRVFVSCRLPKSTVAIKISVIALQHASHFTSNMRAR
jgi:hypothetical protein